ncbi:MAG: hypothetical protein AAF702_32510 [Chloroflexota bacterium]
MATLTAQDVQAQTAFNANLPFPILEEFDNPDAFINTAPDKVTIQDGQVVANIGGEGVQYVYRNIPDFSGDVRLTVTGQVNGFENNCFVYTGIGDSLGDGVAVALGFTGGGCPIQGPLISTSGVILDHEHLCEDTKGNYHWIDLATPYTATLEITDENALLSVPGLGTTPGQLVYNGIFSQLSVGAAGSSPGANDCSVTIERVTIEPLGESYIAPADLEATPTHPTQIDLQWTEVISTDSGMSTYIERSLDGHHWTEIQTRGASSFQDRRVTCGTTYHYRLAIYLADSNQLIGYSNRITASTDACQVIFQEDWESGIRSDRWRSYGTPDSIIVDNQGRSNSRAINPNGDGTFTSGLILEQPFDITAGLNVEYWMKGNGVIGRLWSAGIVELTICTPDDDNERGCPGKGHIATIVASTEAADVVYGTLPETFSEPWEPLNDQWHKYRMHIRPDKLIEFYRDDELKFVTLQPLDFAKDGLAYLRVRGASVNSSWYIDDLVVTAPTAPTWYIKAVNPEGKSVEGVVIYAEGQPIGATNQAGMLITDPMPSGTALAALIPMATMTTTRAVHDEWSYRTYVTSMNWETEPSQPLITGASGEQRLILAPGYPLVLFNLVVSVEWDATPTYLEEIARAMQQASDYLFDLTDGQMAFGEVNIYSNEENWKHADIQISTKNIVRPHAYISGILSKDTSHVIRLGRGWDGMSGTQGAWDQPAGYRTIAHEFGHYALHLYDEYVYFIFDEQGNLQNEGPAFCPMRHDSMPVDDASSASAMYYHYRATELSARGVEALWSSACEHTAQWQFNGESTWETISRRYADFSESPRWRFTTPMDRQGVLAGPTRMPPVFPAWPHIQIHPSEAPAPPRQLTVYDPHGTPYFNAIVALYKQMGGRVISQGLTSPQGQLAIYGAADGDRVRVASFDSGLAGSAVVEAADDVVVTLQPNRELLVRSAQLGTNQLQRPPHVQLRAEPGSNPNQIDLLVALNNFGPDADPGVTLGEPGSDIGHIVTLGYSTETDTHQGQVSFATLERGMGPVRTLAILKNDIIRQYTTYRLQQVYNDASSDLYSNDGNLHLHLSPESLPGNKAYFIIMPPGAIPGSLPAGLTLVGDPYDVTASGALVRLEKPALLTMHYDESLLDRVRSPTSLGIYRWDGVDAQWKVVESRLDEEQSALVATVLALGTYAVLGQVNEEACAECALYIPFIVK